MSNAHHKNKTRRDLEGPGVPTERLSAKAQESAEKLAKERREVEATMCFEDADVTDGGYRQTPPRPVDERRSLTGGSLR